MSPQPLGRVNPDARLDIGPLAPACDFDPDLCRLATHVISLWSYTEAGPASRFRGVVVPRPSSASIPQRGGRGEPPAPDRAAGGGRARDA